MVYKDQVEDVIKAMRRKGFTSRQFSYDKKKFEDDIKNRQLLKEKYENKTSMVHN